MKQPEPVKIEVRKQIRSVTVVSGKWIFVETSKK